MAQLDVVVFPGPVDDDGLVWGPVDDPPPQTPWGYSPHYSTERSSSQPTDGLSSEFLQSIPSSRPTDGLPSEFLQSIPSSQPTDGLSSEFLQSIPSSRPMDLPSEFLNRSLVLGRRTASLPNSLHYQLLLRCPFSETPISVLFGSRRLSHFTLQYCESHSRVFVVLFRCPFSLSFFVVLFRCPFHCPFSLSFSLSLEVVGYPISLFSSYVVNGLDFFIWDFHDLVTFEPKIR